MSKAGIFDMRSLIVKMCIYYAILILAVLMAAALIPYKKTEGRKSEEPKLAMKAEVQPPASLPAAAEIKASAGQAPGAEAVLAPSEATPQETPQITALPLNTYAEGNCTWYAKDKRPDLPNDLGDADTWVIRAKRQGISTGSEPKVGAIGQQGKHVVYIESVNNDGTIFFSEMNYEGLGIISTRTAKSSFFEYIY